MRGVTICLLLLAATGLHAQQPNSARASLRLDGRGGPPVPVEAALYPGGAARLDLAGGAGMVFALAVARDLAPAPLDLGGPGLLDLDPATLTVLGNGWLDPASFVLDASGNWAVSGVVPSPLQVGIHFAWQALVSDPTNPAGATLTAAARGTISTSPEVIPLALPDDGTALVDLGPFGLSVPFYNGVYGGLWVNSNGSLTFGQGDSTYIASTQVFASGPPRIAPFWTDLNPMAGGSISATIDPTVTTPSIQVTWQMVPEAFTPPPTRAHTFTASIDPLSGDLRLVLEPAGTSPWYKTLTGIGPGGSLAPNSWAKDLSLLHAQGGYTGQPLESFFELFGGVGSSGNLPPFDLWGTTLDFLAGLPGTPSAWYVLP